MVDFKDMTLLQIKVMTIIVETSAELMKNGYSEELAGSVIESIQALPIETEEDRQYALSMSPEIIDLLIPFAPAGTKEQLEDQHRQLKALFDKRYSDPNSVYAAVVRITANLAGAIKAGGDADELGSAALEEIQALPCEPNSEEAVLIMEAALRVSAISLAHKWFPIAKGEYLDHPAIMKILRGLNKSFKANKFDKALLLEAAKNIREQSTETAEAQQAVQVGLLCVWGVGLLLRPDAAPALDPIRELIFELSGQMEEQEPDGEEGTSAQPTDQVTPFDAVLNDLKELVERDGFSLYAVTESMKAIHAVPIESDEDYEAMCATRLRMIDMMMPLGSAEDAQNLAVMRSTFVKMETLDPDQKLTLQDARVQIEAIVDELKRNLAAGELASPAINRAFSELRLLSVRGSSDNEESEEANEAFAKFFIDKSQEILSIIKPYVAKQQGNLFDEMTQTLGVASGGLEVNTEDPAEVAAFDRALSEQASRFMQVGLASQDESQIDSHKVASIPHVRQFIELLPFFLERAFASIDLMVAEESDKAEIERLTERIKALTDPIRYAYSEEQIIRHQREGLRGAMLELRQFERRHYLTVVHPTLPTNQVSIDPNAVFVSGTDSVAKLVKDACDKIGMKPARKHALQNQTHGRWQMLRRSGIAIFDYSAYDPKHADPRGAIRRTSKAEEKILSAAGQAATVAYETGWAFALGIPLVIVAQKGQVVPFDIDIEPVFLEHDDGDVERLLIGMQTAYYGPQEGIEGNSLAETVTQVRRLYGDYNDPQVKPLLDSLTDFNDATKVRRVLATVLDRIEGENSLLLCPEFPGSYPSGKERALFHITGFRSWSKPLEAEARQACERAGIEYGIGYERLNADILRRIWQDICEASFVIADITNLNPNALFELAIAHVVGCPTLTLTRNSQPHKFFPAIQKLRTHYYDPDNDRAKLVTLLDAFLRGQE